MPRPPPAFVSTPCPPERAFRFTSGETARSLEEFAARIGREAPSIVLYHKDHFAPWLREVVGDVALARRVDMYAAQVVDATAFRDILLGLSRRRLAELSR